MDRGEKITQQTRLFDANTGKTYAMRSKEEANDYRYFPDPDLLPIEISPELLNTIRENLPELPAEKASRLKNEFSLTEQDAQYLIQDSAMADFFEQITTHSQALSKTVINWLKGDLAALLNKHQLSITQCPISSKNSAQLLDKLADNTISNKIAKTVLDAMWETGKDALSIIKERGLEQMDDSATLDQLISQLIANNPKQVEQFQQGKTKMLGFFVGQIMKATQGRANPKKLNELLIKALTNYPS